MDGEDAVELAVGRAWPHTTAVTAALRPDGSVDDEPALAAATTAVNEAGDTAIVVVVWAQWLASGHAPDEDAFAALCGHPDLRIIARPAACTVSSTSARR